jgi:hypothetical protein
MRVYSCRRLSYEPPASSYVCVLLGVLGVPVVNRMLE